MAVAATKSGIPPRIELSFTSSPEYWLIGLAIDPDIVARNSTGQCLVGELPETVRRYIFRIRLAAAWLASFIRFARFIRSTRLALSAALGGATSPRRMRPRTRMYLVTPYRTQPTQKTAQTSNISSVI